jgi:A/G-specific adenine glycosylase
VKRQRRALLAWYDANKRDLPWRRTRDPYAIWVSETMLQQTRVDTVIPYFESFLERFPDIEALASADGDDVLGQWAGLGYYSRARNLQAAARVLADSHGGRMPDDVDALRSLPGIGRYTAGAVASIAFDRAAPIVDGNVARVLARLLGIREDIKKPEVVKRLWAEAEGLARGPRPGDLNQALMELGALICTPAEPGCGRCPLRRHCDANAQGDAAALPIKQRKPTAKRIEAAAGWLVRRGKVLAVRRPPEGLLGGLWELPGGGLEHREEPAAGWTRNLRERVGLTVARAEYVGSIEHVFTHRRLELHLFRADPPTGRTRLDGFDAHRWLSPRALAELPLSSLTRKALAALDAPLPRSTGRAK